MKFKQKSIELLLLLSITTAAYHQAAAAEVETTKTVASVEINQLLKKAELEGNYPGVSVAVYLQGKPYHVAASGFANLISKDPPDQDTIFRAYSLTKGITQILAAVLADTEVLNLDAPISTYVPALPPHIQAITARQLLSHRAGIRHYQNEQEWLRLSADHCEHPEDAFWQFLNDPLVTEPGVSNGYSSFGYVLLSEVLENAAKKSFRALIEQLIFSFSEVNGIGFDNQSGQPGKLATFYELGQNGPAPAPTVDNSCKFGAGAVVATPKALARIFSDYYAGRFTSKSTLEEFVPAVSRPCEAVSMGGEGMGGRAALFAYPSDGLVVVLMANARGGELVSYGRQIADIVTQAEPETTAACHRK